MITQTIRIPKTQQRGDRLREEVFAIADALLQEGQRPTINKIAQRLGHGSNTTIGEALEIWWSLLHSRLESAFNTPAIDSEIIDLAENLWKRAVEKSSHQYQEDKKQIESALAILQEENTLLHGSLQEQQEKRLSTEQALEQLLNEKIAWQAQQKMLEECNQEQSQNLLKMEAEQQAALLQQQKLLHELSETLQQQQFAHQQALHKSQQKQKDELQNLLQLHEQRLHAQQQSAQQAQALLKESNQALAQQLKTAAAEILHWQNQVTFLKEFSEKQEAIYQERDLEQKQHLARLEQERRYLTKVISNLQKKSRLRRKIDPPDDFF